MEDEWVCEALFQLNWAWKEPWDNEEPEPAERDHPDSLPLRWFSLSLKWFCHRSRQWCWMLTACLRLWTEDLTSGDDDSEHDLEESNLMHNNDFGDSEEVLCDDVLLKNALPFSMKMNLKMIVVNCIETNAWILDIFNNEEVDMNEDFACDECDLLDAQDLDVPTIDAGEGLGFLLDGNVRNKWLKSNWCNCSCINESCPRFLTFLRQWWTDVIDGIGDVDLHDVVFCDTWCEMIDSKLMTTESLTLTRGKDWGHRWWWRWLWKVWLIERLLLMKRSKILKSSELICGHDWDRMIPKLSWDIVHLPLMIWRFWTSSWKTSFQSPPALIGWVTFTTTMRTYLMSLAFCFPTLTLTLIPWPGLTWPCGPLTFSFWFGFSFWFSLCWLPLAFLILRRTLCPLIVLLTSLIYPFPFCLLDSLNPPWRTCRWCRADRSALCLKECCCWSSWWADCECHSMLTSQWCWGKEHLLGVHEHFEGLEWFWCSTQSSLNWVTRACWWVRANDDTSEEHSVISLDSILMESWSAWEVWLLELELNLHRWQPFDARSQDRWRHPNLSLTFSWCDKPWC